MVRKKPPKAFLQISYFLTSLKPVSGPATEPHGYTHDYSTTTHNDEVNAPIISHVNESLSHLSNEIENYKKSHG